MRDREPLERDHLRWLAEHGGGDEQADANCWRDVKPYLGMLLDIADAARRESNDESAE